MNTLDPNSDFSRGTSHEHHQSETGGRSLLMALEPSLWNSKIGRRQFLKRTGAATVGTAIALHGFSTDVIASFSTIQVADYIPKTMTITSGGFALSAEDAMARAEQMKTWLTNNLGTAVGNAGNSVPFWDEFTATFSEITNGEIVQGHFIVPDSVNEIQHNSPPTIYIGLTEQNGVWGFSITMNFQFNINDEGWVDPNRVI